MKHRCGDLPASKSPRVTRPSSLLTAQLRKGNMPKLSNDRQQGNDKQDHRPAVIRTAAWAAGGFTASVGSLVTAAGQLQIPDDTVRFAIMAVFVIAALAQFTAAAYVFRR
jgi:hypothetical protein